MKLKGKQFVAVAQALLDAFDLASLEAMLRIQLDQRLAAITAPGNLTDVVHALIEWAETHDQVQALIDGACAANPGNALLQALHTRVQAEQWFGAAPLVEATNPDIGRAPVNSLDSQGASVNPSARTAPPALTLDSGLKRNLAAGNVCAFVGAGLSRGAGLPDWYELVNELAQRMGYADLPPRQWATSEALIEAAQVYVNRQGLFNLIAFLKERLETFNRTPTAAHLALARLPINLVFTANYDDLLERAYRMAGKRVEVIVKDSTIPFLRRGPDVVNIVKLYGDLNQPETLVLARQQYETFFLERPQMVKLLEVELARSDVLYLGWSHTDPHFNLIFGELLTRFGPFMRSGYAALFDLPTAREEELRRKQIRLAPLPAGPDRTAQLANWLDSLAAGSAPDEPRGATPSAVVASPSPSTQTAPADATVSPITRRAALARLRDLLATLYPDEASLRRLVDDAGLDLRYMALGSSSKNNWHAVLDESEKRRQTGALIAAALAEYGADHPPLRQYVEEYSLST